VHLPPRLLRECLPASGNYPEPSLCNERAGFPPMICKNKPSVRVAHQKFNQHVRTWFEQAQFEMHSKTIETKSVSPAPGANREESVIMRITNTACRGLAAVIFGIALSSTALA